VLGTVVYSTATAMATPDGDDAGEATVVAATVACISVSNLEP
jgi:hypothetical protein